LGVLVETGIQYRYRTLPKLWGHLQIIAAIVDPVLIAKILTHLYLPARAPPRSRARRVDLFQAA